MLELILKSVFEYSVSGTLIKTSHNKGDIEEWQLSFISTFKVICIRPHAADTLNTKLIAQQPSQCHVNLENLHV